MDCDASSASRSSWQGLCRRQRGVLERVGAGAPAGAGVGAANGRCEKQCLSQDGYGHNTFGSEIELLGWMSARFSLQNRASGRPKAGRRADVDAKSGPEDRMGEPTPPDNKLGDPRGHSEGNRGATNGHAISFRRISVGFRPNLASRILQTGPVRRMVWLVPLKPLRVCRLLVYPGIVRDWGPRFWAPKWGF
jgi:hypothetical protein